jgi:hypothetical protein
MGYRPESLDTSAMSEDEVQAMAKIGLWYVRNGYLLDDEGARSDPQVQALVDTLEALDWDITYKEEL